MTSTFPRFKHSQACSWTIVTLFILDAALVPFLLKLAWNDVIVEIIPSTQTMTLGQAYIFTFALGMMLRPGYWFSMYAFVLGAEERFDWGIKTLWEKLEQKDRHIAPCNV